VRRRLLASTLTIALAAVIVFGIPLAFVLDRVIHDTAQARVERDATRLAHELDKSDVVAEPGILNKRLPGILDDAGLDGDSVVVQYPKPSTLRVSTPTIAHAVKASAPGPRGTVVILRAPAGDVDARVKRVLLLLALLALAGLAGALALALLQSHRLTAPLGRLSRSATRLGEGDFSHATPRSGVAEIDSIADALDSSAERIDRLLQAERSFSTNASHQLRSALTGLELRLEELANSSDPEVQEEAKAALEQAHRLGSTVEELLALARTGRTGIVTEFDLTDLARAHALDVSAALGREGRRLSIDAPGPVPVVAAVGALGQALDIVLSNAVRHGKGTLTVRVTSDERHAIVEISDEGRGFDDPETAFEGRPTEDGHGIGLALARTLVSAEGGTIVIRRAAPPTVRIQLPRV
jgi:signal transduction histidine kinase